MLAAGAAAYALFLLGGAVAGGESLFALASIYAVTGTLNMADLAARVAALRSFQP